MSRELQNILSSGEITEIFIGGTESGNEIVTFDDISPLAALSLSESADTVTGVDAWTDILGTLSASPVSGFTATAEGLEYTGTKTIYVKMDAHASVSPSANNTTIYGAVFKNGTILNASVMVTFGKNGGQIYNFSGTSIVSLETGDVLQMRCKTDIAVTLTFETLTANLITLY